MNEKKYVTVKELYELCKAAGQENAEIMIIVRTDDKCYYDMPDNFSVNLKENLALFECEF